MSSIPKSKSIKLKNANELLRYLQDASRGLSRQRKAEKGRSECMMGPYENTAFFGLIFLLLAKMKGEDFRERLECLL